MEKIIEIIEKAYTEVTRNVYLRYFSLISDKADDKSDAKDAFNTVISDEESNSKILLEMLDEIYLATNAVSPHDERTSFVDFYKDSDVIDIDYKRAFTKSAQKYEKNGKFVTSQIKDDLYNRIATSSTRKLTYLYYYYLYHNWYDAVLEKSFRAVVKEAIKRDDSIVTHNYNTSMLLCMAVSISNNKEQYLNSVFNEIKAQVYNNLFCNDYLSKKYIPTDEEFYTHLDENESSGKSLLNYRVKLSKKTRNYNVFNCYKKEATEIMQKEQYLSIKHCYENLNDDTFDTYDKYIKFFQRSFTTLAGYCYDEIRKFFYYENIILYTMLPDFNKNMIGLKNIFNNSGIYYLENGNDSIPAFKITGFKQLDTLGAVPRFYNQLIMSHSKHNKNSTKSKFSKRKFEPTASITVIRKKDS